MSTFFFFNDTATTEIYTLSLHDALPISRMHDSTSPVRRRCSARWTCGFGWSRRSPRREGREDRTLHGNASGGGRSEEHTSELQSLAYIVCRLLLEKKKSSTPSTSPLKTF